MRQPRILAIVGLALVAVVGLLAWNAHRSEAPQPIVEPNAAYPLSNDDVQAPAELPAYATRPPVRTIELPGQAAPPQTVRKYAEGGGVATTPARPRRVVKERPLSHSVAIVGGGAGAGAAIGALAGGGKGAGIGALSGGAAGLIYDRLTHRKVVEQRQ